MITYNCPICNKETKKPKMKARKLYIGVLMTIYCRHCDFSDTTPLLDERHE